MATTNMIKTRILNKYDSYSNYTPTWVPLRGEICIVEVGSVETPNVIQGGFDGKTYEGRPIAGIKVGDGVTSFGNLPWIQAVAGDVSKFIKGIDETNFATKVAEAIGYSTETDVKAAIESINSKFDNYSTTAQMNTELAGKVNNSEFNAYKASVTEWLAGKVDNSSFTTYQGTVTAALDKKVETDYADADASATNKLTSAATVEGKINAAAQSINTKLGEPTKLTTTAKDNLVNAINELDAEIGDISSVTTTTLSAAIKGLQDAVGTNSEGESLAGRVGTLEGEMDTVQAILTGYDNDNTVSAAVADAKAAGTTAQSQVGTLTSLKTDAQTSAVAAINELHDELADEISNRQSGDQGINDRIDAILGDDKKKGDETAQKTIRQIANEELAAQLLDGATNGAEDNFKTLKELADWLEKHPEDASAMNSAIGDNAAAIEALQKLHASDKTVAQEVADGVANRVTTGDFESYKTSISDELAAAASALQKADIAEGTADGTIAVEGDNVKVHGLKSAAYTEASAYATAAQGNTADSALQNVKVLGTTLNKTSNELTVDAAKTALGLGSAAYEDASAFDTFGSASAVDTKLSNFKDAFDGSDLATGNGIIDTVTHSDTGKVEYARRQIKPTDMSTEANDVFIFYCGTASELIN